MSSTDAFFLSLSFTRWRNKRRIRYRHSAALWTGPSIRTLVIAQTGLYLLSCSLWSVFLFSSLISPFHPSCIAQPHPSVNFFLLWIWRVGHHLYDYTVSYPRRLQLVIRYVLGLFQLFYDKLCAQEWKECNRILEYGFHLESLDCLCSGTELVSHVGQLYTKEAAECRALKYLRLFRCCSVDTADIQFRIFYFQSYLET